jgi:hypothetical protein
MATRIELTRSFAYGNETYTNMRVKEIRSHLTRERCFVVLEYGTMNGATFVPGDAPTKEVVIRNREAETDGEREIAPADKAWDRLESQRNMASPAADSALYDFLVEDEDPRTGRTAINGTVKT